MTKLGTVITEAILLHYGKDEFLRRLAHPFWFQSFGSIMGMDWHSSGITTSVIGALKRGLNPRAHELGLHVCGGRGRHSQQTPAELAAAGERAGFDGASLGNVSRLVAKIDSAAVQDGFDLYLHGFIVTDDGKWTVVQQGMNDSSRTARRYHWLSEGMESFVDSPHSAIEGQRGNSIVNLADRRAAASRGAQLELLELGPDHLVKEAAALRPSEPCDQPTLPHLILPSRHDVTSGDIVLRRLHASLAAASEAGPKDFVELLRVPGIGARTIRSLAMVAEVIHGTPCRFSDPARFSLAHGGKDRHPYPVPLKVYDQTIGVLKSAIAQAKLGNDEKIGAIRRLDQQARRLEPLATGPSLDSFLGEERARSQEYGGMSIFGAEPAGQAGTDSSASRTA